MILPFFLYLVLLVATNLPPEAEYSTSTKTALYAIIQQWLH